MTDIPREHHKVTILAPGPQTDHAHMQTKSLQKSAHMMRLFSLLQCHPQDGALDIQQQAERHLIMHKQTISTQNPIFSGVTAAGLGPKKRTFGDNLGMLLCRRPDALPVVQPTVSEN